MSTGSGKDPDFNVAIPKTPPRRRFTLIELLVVIGIIAILIALMLPATRSATGAAHRAQCVNNLKQIALGLHNYERAYNVLPPAYTVDAKGRPLHSWRTLILPFLEAQPIYNWIDLAKPWNDPANAKARATDFSVFHCPASTGPGNTTTYLAITAPNGCFLPTEPRRFADITDRHGSTIMVIEGSEESAVPWMAPFDANESSVVGLGPTARLHHAGGANAVFVDGSTRFLKANTPADVLRALISISGNDDPSADSW
jgi:prepilin-type processing-associated H-X9-DG protein